MLRSTDTSLSAIPISVIDQSKIYTRQLACKEKASLSLSSVFILVLEHYTLIQQHTLLPTILLLASSYCNPSCCPLATLAITTLKLLPTGLIPLCRNK